MAAAFRTPLHSGQEGCQRDNQVEEKEEALSGTKPVPKEGLRTGVDSNSDLKVPVNPVIIISLHILVSLLKRYSVCRIK